MVVTAEDVSGAVVIVVCADIGIGSIVEKCILDLEVWVEEEMRLELLLDAVAVSEAVPDVVDKSVCENPGIVPACLRRGHRIARANMVDYSSESLLQILSL